MALEPSSARGVTNFSATSVSTENVGSTMKSMNPGDRRGHGVAGDTLGTAWGQDRDGNLPRTHRSATGPPAWRCGRRGARRAAPARPPCPPGKARDRRGVPTGCPPRPPARPRPYLPEELLHEGLGPAAVHCPLLGGVADVGRVQQQRQHLGLVQPGDSTPALRLSPEPPQHLPPRPPPTSPAAAAPSSWT